MSGGGSGGGNNGTTKYEWNDDLAPYWRDVLQESNYYHEQPYTPYTGQRVAKQDPYTIEGQNQIRHYLADPQEFSYGKGNQLLQDVVGGKYLSGVSADRYATAGNQYGGMDNQYFTQALSNGADLITQKYKDATDPQLRASAVQAGVLGGGDYQNNVGRAQNALGKQLSDYTAGMQNDQYNRSAQLQGQDMDRGSAAFQQERNRMTQGIGQTQADQGLTLDRFHELYGMGEQNRAYNQQNLDQQYQDWFDQQNWGRNQTAWLSSVLGAAQGGMPANQMTAQRSQTSGVANGLGSALAAYGLFRQ